VKKIFKELRAYESSTSNQPRSPPIPPIIAL
jgi:hypothetical protein